MSGLVNCAESNTQTNSAFCLCFCLCKSQCWVTNDRVFEMWLKREIVERPKTSLWWRLLGEIIPAFELLREIRKFLFFFDLLVRFCNTFLFQFVFQKKKYLTWRADVLLRHDADFWEIKRFLIEQRGSVAVEMPASHWRPQQDEEDDVVKQQQLEQNRPKILKCLMPSRRARTRWHERREAKDFHSKVECQNRAIDS